MRFAVTVSDRPGGLATLVRTIADQVTSPMRPTGARTDRTSRVPYPRTDRTRQRLQRHEPRAPDWRPEAVRSSSSLLRLKRPCFARNDPWLYTLRFTHSCLFCPGRARPSWTSRTSARGSTPPSTRCILSPRLPPLPSHKPDAHLSPARTNRTHISLPLREHPAHFTNRYVFSVTSAFVPVASVASLGLPSPARASERSPRVRTRSCCPQGLC